VPVESGRDNPLAAAAERIGEPDGAHDTADDGSLPPRGSYEELVSLFTAGGLARG